MVRYLRALGVPERAATGGPCCRRDRWGRRSRSLVFWGFVAPIASRLYNLAVAAIAPLWASTVWDGGR